MKYSILSSSFVFKILIVKLKAEVLEYFTLYLGFVFFQVFGRSQKKCQRQKQNNTCEFETHLRDRTHWKLKEKQTGNSQHHRE